LLELPDSLKARYKEQADRCPMKFLYDALTVTTQCESGYRASVNPRLHIEFALMRLSFLSAVPASAPVASPPSAAPAPVVPSERREQPNEAPARPAASASPAPVASPSPAPADSPAPAPVISSGAQATSSIPNERREPSDSPARRTRAARAAMSLKSIMEEPQAAAPEQTDDSVPSDDILRTRWPELAKLYSDKPRLASMLSTTTLMIEEGTDGFKTVTFRVVNDAQKEWVESKLLHELEGNYRKVVGSIRVYLRVSVIPDTEPQQKKIYMPSDQAKELMAGNEEVKSLVKDLELDIK
ncbi:MAG: hypothetical protein IJ005_01440, partial [Bacteroidales bacterium]|nr:hypothetical protein [Bacteroidales bacterium]